MGLPRPINWLHTGDINVEAAREVQLAAIALKEELDSIKGNLGEMESVNQDAITSLNQSLSQISSGAPNRLFIVSTWFGFLPEDVPPEIENLRFSSSPFRSPELATTYANQMIGLMQSMVESGVDIRPEQVEDTPDDILTKLLLYDTNDVINGYMEIKYWQYNPDVEIPEDAGGGTGDWV